MRQQILILMLLCFAPIWAQQQNVSGTVKGPDGGIAKVSVREIDENRRVFNHTATDQNGLFSFQVRDAQHSLQFYAPGYRTLTHKMLGATSLRVTMEKRRTSPYVATAKVLFKSDKLVCGHYLGDIVPQQAWVEKLCDTLYAIILPVEMERMVDEYAAGRSLLVLDEMGRQVMQCENVVDVYPLREAPDEVDQSRLAQNYTGVGRVTGVDDEGTRLYAYPHFQFSRAQLEKLCDNPQLLGRLAVDTYRGNNYWNFFPTDRTVMLLRKALKK